MTHHPRRIVTAAAALLALTPLAGCSGGTSSGVTASASSAAPTTSPASGVTTSPSTTAPTTSAAAVPGAAVPTSGPELAAALRAACTGTYTVKTTITGTEPATMVGRGVLADKSLAAHLLGDADTEQDVEVVGGKAYTSLPGATTGVQRIVVDLADPSDQLVESVAPIIGATDLGKVVTAVAGSPSITVTGREVTAVVPARSLVTLFGGGLDGSVPASAPLHLTLDAAGRPTTVTVALGPTKRVSTYGGWAPGAAITAPPATAIVDSPL